MTPAEKKLTAYLLKLASTQFANHGCNDLDLVKEVGLTPEESLTIRQGYHVYNRDELAPEEEPNRHHTMDFAMMSFMAKKVAEGT